METSGNVQCEETIGGSGTDQAYDVQLTADGGYIVAGMSSSGISGYKTEALIGINDCLVVKLDRMSKMEWQNNIGNSSNDEANW